MSVFVDRIYFESLQIGITEKNEKIKNLQARNRAQEESWARHKAKLNEGTYDQ